MAPTTHRPPLDPTEPATRSAIQLAVLLVTWSAGRAVVAATGAAGAVFAWLRLRSGSVVAPWLVHAVLNTSTFSVGVAVAA